VVLTDGVRGIELRLDMERVEKMDLGTNEVETGNKRGADDSDDHMAIDSLQSKANSSGSSLINSHPITHLSSPIHSTFTIHFSSGLTSLTRLPPSSNE